MLLAVRARRIVAAVFVVGLPAGERVVAPVPRRQNLDDARALAAIGGGGKAIVPARAEFGALGLGARPGEFADAHVLDPDFAHAPRVLRPKILGPVFGVVANAEHRRVFVRLKRTRFSRSSSRPSRPRCRRRDGPGTDTDPPRGSPPCAILPASPHSDRPRTRRRRRRAHPRSFWARCRRARRYCRALRQGPCKDSG